MAHPSTLRRLEPVEFDGEQITGTTTYAHQETTVDGERSWEHNRYTVHLGYRGNRMTMPYMEGIGISPDVFTLHDVLGALAAELHYRDYSLDDYLGEFGMVPHDGPAVYRQVQDLNKRTLRLFGGREEAFIEAFDAH